MTAEGDDVEPRDDRRSATERSLLWRACQAPIRIGATVAFDHQAFHADRIPRRGGVLMISNHQSYLDPPLLGAQITSRPIAFLARAELFRFPPFGWLISRLNAFPVKQGKGDFGAMRESIRLLQAGWLLNMFPEGGRTLDGRLQPAQKGAGLMIRKAGVPVVPAVIDGTYDAWPKHRKFPRPGPVRVMYGRPTDLAHMKSDDIRRWIDDTFARMLDDLRAGRV